MKANFLTQRNLVQGAIEYAATYLEETFEASTSCNGPVTILSCNNRHAVMLAIGHLAENGDAGLILVSHEDEDK